MYGTWNGPVATTTWRAENLVRRADLEAIHRLAEVGGSGIEPDRQAERRCVVPEIAGDRVLAWIGVLRAGEWHAGQGVVLRRGEQGQRVPAGAPAVPDFGT